MDAKYSLKVFAISLGPVSSCSPSLMISGVGVVSLGQRVGVVPLGQRVGVVSLGQRSRRPQLLVFVGVFFDSALVE